MTQVLVLGDGARPPTVAPHCDTTLDLRTEGKNPNVRLHVDVFRTKIQRELPDRLDDLLRISAFVYSADTRVRRGTDKDVFASKWPRTFHMALPVWDLAFWTDAGVLEALTETINFLTGDEFTFNFEQRTDRASKQGLIDFKELIHPLPLVDTVISFSGGSDSLAAVLEAIEKGRHPILVSHRPTPPIDTRQRNLVNHLRSRFPQWSFPHISMWANRMKDGRAVDFTQRSRSFLYTCASAITSALLNVNEVFLCDNGVVSLNLPQSGQNYQTFLSRSTHPHYLSLAERLLRLIIDNNKFSISNSLIYKTKKEVLEKIVDSGYPELLQETVSCAHVEGKTKHQPHCGVCTQCIDRRFASVAAGLGEFDLPSRYELDIFTDSLKEGIDRTHAENYVRFARKLEKIHNADQFFEEFSELYDCLPADDPEAAAKSIWELFQRHQLTVNGVLEEKIREHAADIRRATLPADSLLGVVTNGLHEVDARIRYIKSLSSLLCKSLPTTFQSRPPKNERDVQDAGEAVFQAAKEFLYRETPQIPFCTVSTKADFSNLPSKGIPLFLEFKLLKDRKRLNSAITEMTSRVLIYRKQGAWILFVIYDSAPRHAIVDDEKFSNDFTQYEGVHVVITR